MQATGGSLSRFRRINPQQESETSSKKRQTWRQRSTQSLKFKKIERAMTQLTLPTLELSPVRRPPKTLKTVLANTEHISRMRQRERENLAILDGYLANFSVADPPPLPPTKQPLDNNIDKCYNKQTVGKALTRLLTNRDLLSQLNDEHLYYKVRNAFKGFDCYPQLMDVLSDTKPADQLLQAIYDEGVVSYDMAREVVKAEEALRKCIYQHQQGTLSSINKHIHEQHDAVIELFNRLNLKMVRKSTDYRQKQMLRQALSKIDLDKRSFLQTTSKDIARELRHRQQRLGPFQRINPMVLSHSRMLISENERLRGDFS